MQTSTRAFQRSISANTVPEDDLPPEISASSYRPGYSPAAWSDEFAFASQPNYNPHDMPSELYSINDSVIAFEPPLYDNFSPSHQSDSGYPQSYNEEIALAGLAYTPNSLDGYSTFEPQQNDYLPAVEPSFYREPPRPATADPPSVGNVGLAVSLFESPHIHSNYPAAPTLSRSSSYAGHTKTTRRKRADTGSTLDHSRFAHMSIASPRNSMSSESSNSASPNTPLTPGYNQYHPFSMASISSAGAPASSLSMSRAHSMPSKGEKQSLSASMSRKNSLTSSPYAVPSLKRSTRKHSASVSAAIPKMQPLSPIYHHPTPTSYAPLDEYPSPYVTATPRSKVSSAGLLDAILSSRKAKGSPTFDNEGFIHPSQISQPHHQHSYSINTPPQTPSRSSGPVRNTPGSRRMQKSRSLQVEDLYH